MTLVRSLLHLLHLRTSFMGELAACGGVAVAVSKFRATEPPPAKCRSRKDLSPEHTHEPRMRCVLQWTSHDNNVIDGAAMSLDQRGSHQSSVTSRGRQSSVALRLMTCD
jgi:hypothetical protein